MNEDFIIIPVVLTDGKTIMVEAKVIGEQQIAFQSHSFEKVTDLIKGFANDIANTLNEIHQEIKPNKFNIKIGLEIGLKEGNLTALIVKGISKGNIEITMEWEK